MVADRRRALLVDLEEPAVSSGGMDRNDDFPGTSWTPADIGVACLILANPAVDAAALEHDSEVVFIIRLMVV